MSATGVSQQACYLPDAKAHALAIFDRPHMSVVTRTSDEPGNVGTFGWDGGYGTTWYCDPHQDMVSILMPQVMWTSPTPPKVAQDFRALAYRALDD